MNLPFTPIACAAAVAACCAQVPAPDPLPVPAETVARAGAGSDPALVLEHLAFLVGGRWIGDGVMSNGRTLDTELEFDWRVGGRILHSTTFERVSPSSDERRVEYEAWFFLHPGRQEVVFLDVGRGGALHEGLARATESGVEVRYSRFDLGRAVECRDTFERRGPDDVRWRSFVLRAGDWHPILSCDFHRAD